MAYRVLSHTADTGIEAEADSYLGLLAELARGMFALMHGEPPPATDQQAVEFEVSGEDPLEAVVELLSELLWRSEAEELAFARVELEESDGGLQVTAWGVPSNRVELVGPPIKAVTYHQLQVEETPQGWRGQVIFDV